MLRRLKGHSGHLAFDQAFPITARIDGSGRAKYLRLQEAPATPAPPPSPRPRPGGAARQRQNTLDRDKLGSQAYGLLMVAPARLSVLPEENTTERASCPFAIVAHDMEYHPINERNLRLPARGSYLWVARRLWKLGLKAAGRLS